MEGDDDGGREEKTDASPTSLANTGRSTQIHSASTPSETSGWKVITSEVTSDSRPEDVAVDRDLRQAQLHADAVFGM